MVRPWLQLIRAQNLSTALADVLAGYLYIGGTWAGAHRLLPLLAASIFLYAGGAALNDVWDADRDAADHRARPIPEGRITREAACSHAIAMLLLGIIWASRSSTGALGVALALVLAIVLYDTILKTTPAAPMLMGACRALNLLMGMTPVDRDPMDAAVLLPVGLMWLYVASLTLFARTEARPSDPARLMTATVGMGVACIAQLTLWRLLPVYHPVGAIPVLLLATFVSYIGVRAAHKGDPSTVQNAVAVFLLGIVAFNVCLVFPVRGLEASLVVGACAVPPVLLARTFQLT